jgi:hypothetical protein
MRFHGAGWWPLFRFDAGADEASRDVTTHVRSHPGPSMAAVDLMICFIDAEVSTRGCFVMIPFEQLISRTLRYNPLPLRVELTTFNPLEDVSVTDSDTSRDFR